MDGELTDEDVVRRILMYQDGMDPRLEEMLDRWILTDKVNKRLNDAMNVSPLSDEAYANADKQATMIPLLPKVAIFKIDEWDNLTVNSLDHLYLMDFRLGLTIMPMRDFDSKNKIVRVTYDVGATTGEKVNYLQCELLSYSQKSYTIRCTAGFYGLTLDKTYTMPPYELVDMAFCYVRAVKTREFTNRRKDPDDNDFNLDIQDMKETFDEKVSVVFRKYVIPQDEKVYKIPTFSVISDSEKYNDVSVPKDFVHFKVNKVEGLVTPDITFNLECTKLDLPEYIITVDDRDNQFQDKLGAETLYSSYLVQGSMYSALRQEISEEAGSMSPYSTDELLTQVVIRIGEIDEILSRVSVWNPFTLTFDQTNFTVYNFENPIYRIKNIDKQMINIPGETERQTRIIKYNNTKVSQGMASASIYETIRGPDTSQDQSVLVLLSQDENMVIYAEIEGVSTPTSEELDMDSNSFLISAERDELGVVISSGGLYNGTNSILRSNVYIDNHMIVPTFESMYNLMIRNIYVCDLVATDYLRITSGSVTIDAYHGIETFSRTYTGVQTGKLFTNEFGELYCGVFEADIMFTNELKTMVALHAGPKDHSIDIYEYEWSKTDKSGMAKRIDALEDRIGTVSCVLYPNVSGLNTEFAYQNINVVVNVSKQALLNGANWIDSEVPVSRPEPPGTSWIDITKKRFERAARDGGILLRARGSLTGERQEPPNDLGIRKAANEAQLSQQQFNINMMYEIELIVQEFNDLASRVDNLENQMKALMDMLNPSFVDSLLQEMLNIAISTAIPYAAPMLIAFTKQVEGALMSAHKVFKAALSNATKRATLLLGIKKAGIALSGISEFETFLMNLALATKKNLNKIKKIPRPGWKNGSYNLQNVDASEMCDLLTGIYTNGRTDPPAAMLPQLRPTVNRLKENIILPSYNVHYRPLGFLPDNLASNLHDLFTVTTNNRNKLKMDNVKLSTTLPSHSFTTVEWYGYDSDGYINKKMLYMGIGELNRRATGINDKNAGIGGIFVEFRSNSRTIKGVQIYVPKSFQECGYTVDDVRSLYISLYKRPIAKDRNESQAWNIIVSEVENTVMASDLMGYTYVPDPSKLEVLRELIHNPPYFNYNLINRNCQDFVLDLMKYVTTGKLPSKWSLDEQAKAVMRRTQIANGFLEDLDPLPFRGRVYGIVKYHNKRVNTKPVIIYPKMTNITPNSVLSRQHM